MIHKMQLQAFTTLEYGIVVLLLKAFINIQNVKTML